MDFFNTFISEESIALALGVLQSGWVSEGERVKAFESSLANDLDLNPPVLVNSGTSALHLSLVLSGINSKDEVILPAQTFVATGHAILMQGATPVFCDIDPLTGNMDIDSMRSKITDRTKAIMPVHWGGYPCDLTDINEIAKANSLSVIEDAAHALGATYNGKKIGGISRFTVFSFQAIKHLTTGDGGALCCLSEDDAEKARIRRWFGIDRTNSTSSILGERQYDIAELGFKYHMNDLAAAIGLGNLLTFKPRLARRQEIGRQYRLQLKNVTGIELLRCESDRTHAYWLFTMLVEERERFIRKLAKKGIPASVVHQRIDRNTIFGGLRPDLPGQEEFDRRQISIPVHDDLTDDDVDLIIRTIQEGW